MSIDRITNTKSPGNVVYEISVPCSTCRTANRGVTQLQPWYVFAQDDVRANTSQDVFLRMDGLVMLKVRSRKSKWNFKAEDGSEVDARIGPERP